jgi:hypothetical protein
MAQISRISRDLPTQCSSTDSRSSCSTSDTVLQSFGVSTPEETALTARRASSKDDYNKVVPQDTRPDSRSAPHPTPNLPRPGIMIARATTLSQIASVTLVLIALLKACPAALMTTASTRSNVPNSISSHLWPNSPNIVSPRPPALASVSYSFNTRDRPAPAPGLLRAGREGSRAVRHGGRRACRVFSALRPTGPRPEAGWPCFRYRGQQCKLQRGRRGAPCEGPAARSSTSD